MRSGFALALLLAPTLVSAQSPATSSPPGQTAPSAAPNHPAGPADLLQLTLDKHLYFLMGPVLDRAPTLTPEQRSFFTGMLAFHQAHLEDARNDLTAAVNAPNSTLTSNQLEAALETLGETARLTSHYGACAQMYDDIDKTWGARLGPDRQNVKEKRHLCAVQQHTPPQTIDLNAAFTIHAHGLEYPVRIGAVDGFAQIDTGAAESVITESTAKAWGITPTADTVVMYGYGGGRFSAHPAVIPALTLGAATLHHVAVMVTPDDNFALVTAALHLTSFALLGFPVAHALGSLTYTRGGSLTVSPDSAPSTAGATLWLGDSLLLVELNTMPVIEAGKLTGSTEPRLFVLDTGSRDSWFTDLYFAEHKNIFNGPPPATAELAGAGGVVEIPAFIAKNLPLWVGANGFFTSGQHVLTQPTGGEVEHYAGLIGQDMLHSFSSYTIDLRNMRLTIDP